MKRAYLGMVLVSLLSAGACSDENPEDQCRALLETTCRRIRECGEELTGEKLPSSFDDECVESVMKGVGGKGCEAAVDVSSSYDQCIDTLNDLECDELLSEGPDGMLDPTLPNSCSKVIKVE